VSHIDPVDVLFVIDDGPSMREEQSLLARELPAMLRAMTEGSSRSDGSQILPIGSLHAAVLSSDLGSGTATGDASCSALGDDGVLRRSATCGTDGAPFVWHFTGYHDPELTSAALSCNALLGSQGCSISQPLEATLKALLPLDTRDPDAVLDRPDYLAVRGHGRTENLGFLRNDPTRGTSLLEIVVITDKDDCSIASPTASGPAGEALCASNTAIHSVARYVTAFRAIRPDHVVQVAIIAGLPADLELAASDLTLLDAKEDRDAYYDRVLADPRLQTSDVASDRTLQASCTGREASAMAPRRLIQLAKELGQAASVISICRDDWSRVLERHLQTIVATRTSAVLLPAHLKIEDEHTQCRMTWELPSTVEAEQPLTPARCSDRPDVLSTRSPEFPRITEEGRTICEVRRAPFTRDPDGGILVDGEGFYTAAALQRGRHELVFTEHAQPSYGVTMRFSCSTSECTETP
jgi:hypothetical protein